MRYHLNSSWMWGCVVLALAVPAAAVPAVAEEAGQWFGRAVLVTLSSKSVKLEDRADHTVSVTEFDGAVFNADGKPFLDKARYQVVDLTDAGTSSGGHKTFRVPLEVRDLNRPNKHREPLRRAPRIHSELLIDVRSQNQHETRCISGI